ncbi:MAG: hypothetical protein HKN17_08545 [Rhodothermales bacterium]|nr:hypothetical protein [Rhodothermales bacterium]
MESVFISALDTIDLIADALSLEFPDTEFTVRPEEDVLLDGGICGVDVDWDGGPSREQVQDIVDRFQGVNWDPGTGSLSGRSHWVVDSAGRLVQIFYNIDYVFCNGPRLVLAEH